MVEVECELCGGNPPKSATPQCVRCGQFIGYPNVREVEHEDEKDALEARYQKAIEESKRRRAYTRLMGFEADMQSTHAVINVNIDFLYHFITYHSALHSTYTLQTEGAIRKMATSEDDKRRKGVESTLFGSYAKEIRYAALALDGPGLTSYGPFTLQLRPETITIRATLLEENSYDFVKKHRILAGEQLPPGYRARWPERHKLAVAKHAEHISENTKPEAHAGILLSSEGNREKDSFIEVHIYGPFDLGAIEAVMGKVDTKSKRERATLEEIKECLEQEGIAFLEP